MKKVAFLLIFVSNLCLAQVGIGTTTPDTTAALDITSTTSGILIPRMSEADRIAIASPATGLLVYQIDNTTGFWFHDGSSWAALGNSTSWNLNGNSGTNPATNFFGTMDDVDFVFKRNNIFAGRLNSSNTAFGVNSLISNTVGIRNTATGVDALSNNTMGHSNTANGWRALYSNTDGYYNTANGRNALYYNTTGNYNTANGYSALSSNITGYNNTAIGAGTLGFNTHGFFNTAIGEDALGSNSVGNYNTATGNSALYGNNIGSYNTANGVSALRINNAGSFNTAIGYDTLASNSSGSYNTTIGVDALRTNSSGSNNTAIGYGALRVTTGDNNVALGYNAGSLASGSNQLYIENSNANSSTALIYGEFDNDILRFNASIGVNTGSPTSAVHINHPNAIATEGLTLANQFDLDSWRMFVESTNDLLLLFNNVSVGSFDDTSGIYTSVSDRNLKKNIVPTSNILTRLQALQVVDYNFKFQKGSKKYTGLIAQEVEKLFPNLVIPPEKDSDNYTMDYSGFGVLAIKGLQEQQTIIETQKTKIEALENRLLKLEALVSDSN